MNEEQKIYEKKVQAATKELKKLDRRYGKAFESAARRLLFANVARRKLEKEIATAREGLDELERKRRRR